jgi:predicted  nucleic acid-binding Zn-ribbon protein
MPKITEEQIVTLVKLQKIDSETQKLESFLKEMPVRIGILDERLEKFVHSVKEDGNVISELNKEYRTYESDAQMNLGKIQKSQEKLRSVKTNKEYQSSLKEIEDIELKNSRIEDEMLEFLEQIESAEKKLNGRKQRYSQIVDDTDLEKDSIKRDTEQCKQKLSQLESDRTTVMDALDSTILDIFYRVKAKQSDAVAIAEVKDAVCQGCNLNIPPQMYIELQHRNSLKNCPSCERIIYWEDHNERPE